MQLAAVAPTSSSPPSGSGSPTRSTSTTASTATSAFGLGFDALLKIILTQLTYQDPLKPMDNFQFVSQLAQFSQVQLGQTTNDKLAALVATQGSLQAATLLGKTVDVGSGASLLSGIVTAVSMAEGAALLTIETTAKQTVSGIALTDVTQVREGK